jgi:hypothetical protein
MTHLLRKQFICSIAVLCALSQLCLGAKSSAKNGVGIFDTLFIASNTSLNIQGDVYLKHAHVLGKGTLAVQGESRGKIVSDHSEVNNLKVTTHSKVRLEGELTVNHSLTVQSGIFDLSAGKLDVSDSTEVKILNGAEIQTDTRISGLPTQNAKHLSVDFSSKAILASFYKVDPFISWKRQPRNIAFTRHVLQAYKEGAYVPPEEKWFFQSILLVQNHLFLIKLYHEIYI